MNDVNAMIDSAKIADLVLLLVDGSYGFEMVGKSLHFLRTMLQQLNRSTMPYSVSCFFFGFS